MKNIIEYYYNIYITEIRMIEDNYYFIYNGNEYIFSLITNIEELEEKYLLNKQIFNNNLFHTIIMNKEKKIVTFDGSNYYILLKVNLKFNRSINLDDVIECSNIPLSSVKEQSLEWKKLWQQKIDSFEYYIDYIGDKKEENREYFDYFIGMSESALTYLENAEKTQKDHRDYPCICHKRINMKYTLYDLYNPLNVQIDHKSRDLSDYMKDIFFNISNANSYVEDIIKKINLSMNGYILLISRMLLPTFFFDIYESKDNNRHSNMRKLISVMPEYEQYVNNIINTIKKRVNIPSIKWLNN